MIYHNILIPYDKSDSARHALVAATRIVADDPKAKLHILYSADMTDLDFMMLSQKRVAVDPEAADVDRLRGEYIDRRLADIKEDAGALLKDTPVEVVYEVECGKPADAILEYSEKNGCDLICMGCRGIGALRGVLGSVSYAVLRSADAQVLIVK